MTRYEKQRNAQTFLRVVLLKENAIYHKTNEPSVVTTSQVKFTRVISVGDLAKNMRFVLFFAQIVNFCVCGEFKLIRHFVNKKGQNKVNLSCTTIVSKSKSRCCAVRRF